MNHGQSGASLVQALRGSLAARAVGLWKVEPTGLALVAFAPAPDLDPGVARGFTETTLWVGREHAELGIVKALETAATVVSRTVELAPDIGSGRWLRAFKAARSVAVPLVAEQDQVVGILSAALGEGMADDDAAVSIRAAGAHWDRLGTGRGPLGD